MEDDAQLLLETVKETLNPVSGTYTIQINLPDRNPYFGLYIRGVPIDRISSFACAVEEPVGGRQATVNISRNSISVVAYEPFVVVGAARRYLNSPAAVS